MVNILLALRFSLCSQKSLELFKAEVSRQRQRQNPDWTSAAISAVSGPSCALHPLAQQAEQVERVLEAFFAFSPLCIMLLHYGLVENRIKLN